MLILRKFTVVCFQTSPSTLIWRLNWNLSDIIIHCRPDHLQSCKNVSGFTFTTQVHNPYFLKQKYNLFLLDLAYSWSFIYKNPLYNLYSYNHSTSSESRLSLFLWHWLVRTFILQAIALVKIINKREKFLPYAFPWKTAETKVINSAENTLAANDFLSRTIRGSFWSE